MRNKVKSINKNIEEIKKNKTSLLKKLEDDYKQFEPKLMKIINSINFKFGEYMKELGYVGEVLLTKESPVSTYICFYIFFYTLY